MNAKQANTILLTDVLSKLGYKVYQTHKGGAELAYLSPFRTEAKPSFYVNIRKNAWYDHGQAQGAYSVVDFAVEYLKCNGRSFSVSDALNWIESLGLHDLPANAVQTLANTQNVFSIQNEDDYKDLEFIRAFEVKHPAIINYLKGRGLSEQIIKHHLLEIQYRNHKVDKVYFGFGMKNISEGFEIRSAMDSPSFKSALIERNITFKPGTKEGSTDVNIFEGMTDYLSLLQFYNCLNLGNDTIIMHSLSSYKNAVDFIHTHKYTNLNLWLDNDNSGKKACGRFKDDFGTQIKDQSFRYQSFNDINDALKAVTITKSVPLQTAFVL